MFLIEICLKTLDKPFFVDYQKTLKSGSSLPWKSSSLATANMTEKGNKSSEWFMIFKNKAWMLSAQAMTLLWIFLLWSRFFWDLTITW